MVYINIHMGCRSVLVKLQPITVNTTVFGGMRGSCVECHLLSLVSPIVSCSMIVILILGCLWPLVFVLNNILTLGILRSEISHLRGCFCPGLPFRISDSAWSNRTLYVTSRYSTRIFYKGVSGFATDCPRFVWCRGLSTCLLYVRTQPLRCRFGIRDCISSFLHFDICNCIWLNTSYVFWLYLCILNNVLYFFYKVLLYLYSP